MRLFLALMLDPELVREVAGPVEAALGPILGDLRLVPAGELHSTLHFLGATEPAAAAALTRELDAALAGAVHPELVLTGTGVFPSPPGPRGPRVFWVGLDEAAGAAGRLVELRERVLAAVRRAGIAVPEAEQAFAPHLTVARARERSRVHATPAFRELRFGLEWRPESLALVESRPAGSGARYAPVREWPLAQPT